MVGGRTPVFTDNGHAQRRPTQNGHRSGELVTFPVSGKILSYPSSVFVEEELVAFPVSGKILSYPHGRRPWSSRRDRKRELGVGDWASRTRMKVAGTKHKRRTCRISGVGVDLVVSTRSLYSVFSTGTEPENVASGIGLHVGKREVASRREHGHGFMTGASGKTGNASGTGYGRRQTSSRWRNGSHVNGELNRGTAS